MALPPSPAAAPAPGDAALADAGGVPVDMPADDAGGDEVVATILRTADGKYKLVAGDEPEVGGEMPAGGAGGAPEGEAAGPEAQTFDSPGQLMQALMPLLDEGTKGAEDSFGRAFRGEPDAAGPAAPMPG